MCCVSHPVWRARTRHRKRDDDIPPPLAMANAIGNDRFPSHHIATGALLGVTQRSPGDPGSFFRLRVLHEQANGIWYSPLWDGKRVGSLSVWLMRCLPRDGRITTTIITTATTLGHPFGLLVFDKLPMKCRWKWDADSTILQAEVMTLKCCCWW